MAREGQEQPERRAPIGLAAGAVLCVFLAAASGHRYVAVPAFGVTVGAVMAYRKVVEHQPYAYWVAWAAGVGLSLLVAWMEPGSALVTLPWAAASAIVSVVLFARWRAHQSHES